MVWIAMRFWRSVTPRVSLFSENFDLNCHNKLNLIIGTVRRVRGPARLRVGP